MLSKEERKQAIEKFKESRVTAGIYAIHSEVSGRIWVGSARNLKAAQNGAWFSLRIGAHRDIGLQTEWGAYGEQAFRFEKLEALPEDTHPLRIADELKERRRYWLETLSGAPLL